MRYRTMCWGALGYLHIFELDVVCFEAAGALLSYWGLEVGIRDEGCRNIRRNQCYIDNVVAAATKRPRIGLVPDSVSREDWQVMRGLER